MNLNRVLYSMCYDMLEQRHEAFKTDNGIAILCPETPLWIWLAQGGNTADARLFFNDFLRQSNEKLIGIVAEKDIALECAKIYASAKGISFSQKEIIAYCLPHDAVLPNVFASGEIRSASETDASNIHTTLGWIKAFYAETLNVIPPAGNTGESSAANIEMFFWHDTRPVAMGTISGSGETCRINLVYVPPEFRGKGYGKAIVSALATKAREHSRLPVLYTARDNTAANKLYLSLGFKDVGMLTEVGFLY